MERFLQAAAVQYVTLRERTTPIVTESVRMKVGEWLDGARIATERLAGHAIEMGVDPLKFDHLENVWDPDAYTVVPDSTMDYLGVCSPITGEIMISERGLRSLYTTFHESIHRAAALRSTADGTPHPSELVARVFGYTVNSDHVLVPLEGSESPRLMTAEEQLLYQKHFYFVSKQLLEGVTEWSVLRADGLSQTDGAQAIINPSDSAYLRHVCSLDNMFAQWDLSQGELDMLLIQTALTKDFFPLFQTFGQRINLREGLIQFLDNLDDPLLRQAEQPMRTLP